MTDAWIQGTIIPNSGPISNLYQAVKMGQQAAGAALQFCYNYRSINGNGAKNYCAKALVDYFYYSMYLMTLSPANLAAFIAITPQDVTMNGTPYTLTDIDMEVLVLLMQMNPVSNLYSATKYAQQYRANGKCYCYTGNGFLTFAGVYLPQIGYGQNQLYQWALQCL